LSEPNTIPEPDPGQSHDPMDPPGAGTKEGASNEGSETSTPTGAEAERLAWTEQVRSNPDFALEQVKKFQSQADRLRGEHETLKKRAGSLLDLLKQDGSGEWIAQRALAAEKLLAHPDYAEAVQAAASGQVIPPRHDKAEAADDFRDPEVIRLETTIDELRAELRTVQSQSTSVAMGQAKQHATRVFGEILGELDLTTEQRERVIEGGMADIANIDPSVLSRLDPANAKAIVLRHLSWEELDAARDRKRLRERQARGPLATDGPSRVAPGQTEKTRVTIADAVQEALREAGAGRL